MRNKYFKVEAKCGHVGRGKCILITFATMAENGKEAAAKVRNIPRVKHGHKDAIRSVKKIEFEEFVEIEARNSIDPYLHCKNIQEQRKIPDFEARVIDDECEIRMKKKEDKNFHRRLLELAINDAEIALKNYLKVGECV